MFSLPNLSGRYEYSQGKAANDEKPEITVVAGNRRYEECLGGCGQLVAPGQKCPSCAAAAVDEWKRERNEQDVPKVRKQSVSKPRRRR